MGSNKALNFNSRAPIYNVEAAHRAYAALLNVVMVKNLPVLKAISTSFTPRPDGRGKYFMSVQFSRGGVRKIMTFELTTPMYMWELREMAEHTYSWALLLNPGVDYGRNSRPDA